MRVLLIVSVVLYVVLSLGGATAAAFFTIQIYTQFGRELPEILSATIVNTAAVFAATSFIGVLDMFMTLWTLLKSKDWEEEARKEREKEREERVADRQVREKERVENRQRHEAELQARKAELQAREKEREENRQLREKELEVNRQARAAEQQARERELEINRQLREAELQARIQSMESERLAREQSLQENRAFQQQILDQLAADRQAQAVMTTRVLDLLEQMSHRLNGNSNGSNNGGGPNNHQE